MFCLYLCFCEFFVFFPIFHLLGGFFSPLRQCANLKFFTKIYYEHISTWNALKNQYDTSTHWFLKIISPFLVEVMSIFEKLQITQFDQALKCDPVIHMKSEKQITLSVFRLQNVSQNFFASFSYLSAHFDNSSFTRYNSIVCIHAYIHIYRIV